MLKRIYLIMGALFITTSLVVSFVMIPRTLSVIVPYLSYISVKAAQVYEIIESGNEGTVFKWLGISYTFMAVMLLVINSLIFSHKKLSLIATVILLLLSVANVSLIYKMANFSLI